MGGAQSSSHDDTMEESTMTDSIGDKTEGSLGKTPPLPSSHEQEQEVSQKTAFNDRESAPNTLVVQYSTVAITEARGKTKELSNEDDIVCNGISNHVDCGGQGNSVNSLPVGMEVGTEDGTSALEVGLSTTSVQSVEIEERVREVTIDKECQLALLERVVSLTEGKNLQVLQKLHSMLAHLVFRHRLAEDRNQLLKVGHVTSTSCNVTANSVSIHL